MSFQWVQRFAELLHQHVYGKRVAESARSPAKVAGIKRQQDARDDWDGAADYWDPAEFDLEMEDRDHQSRPNDYEWDTDTQEEPRRRHRH